MSYIGKISPLKPHSSAHIKKKRQAPHPSERVKNSSLTASKARL